MKSAIFTSLATAAIVLAAPAAQATVFPVGSANFTGTPGLGGTFAGAFFNTGIASGNFTDSFTFTLPVNGFGSGTVTTSTSVLNSPNDLDFTSAYINGTSATITKLSGGAFEVAFADMVPITGGMLNTLTINGFSRGGGAYGGQLAFIPTSAIPEPSTWAMLLVGFGMIAGAARYRRRRTSVVFG